MAFMVPVYYFGHMWQCVDCDASDSDQCDFPFVEFSQTEAEDLCGGTEVTLSQEGWWVRLAAPGYMDVTEWEGPFSSEVLARESIQEEGLHPDTGDGYTETPSGAVRDNEFEDFTKAAAEQPLTDRGYIDEARKYTQRLSKRRSVSDPKPKPAKPAKQRLIDFLAGPKRRR